HHWIEASKEKGINHLQKMVQLDSTQGNEKDVQLVVADILQALGLEVDIWDLNGERLQKHPYFYSNRETFDGSPNVVGVLKGTGGGKSIILNGHVDVVPEGDHDQWDEGPYSGKIIDGKMYGRGATDMKGGNVALMMALEASTGTEARWKG